MADFDKISINRTYYNVKDTTARQQIAAETTAREQMDSLIGTDIDALQQKDREQDALISDLQNRKSGVFVDAKLLGVTGDGQTDDTAAINSALAENKNIYFSPGTYVVSGTVFVPSHVHIIANAAKILQKLSNAVTFRINNTSDIIIDGLSFQAVSRPTTAGDNSYAIGMYGCDGVTISNCIFDNFTSGIYSEDAGAFYNQNINIINNKFKRYSFAILLAQTKNVLIDNNIGTDVVNDHINPSSSVLDPPHLIYGTDRTSQLTPENITITNNKELGNPYAASFKWRNAKNLVMSGNISSGACRGIELASVTDAIVSDNLIIGMVEPPSDDLYDCAFFLYDVGRVSLLNNNVQVNKGVSKYIVRMDVQNTVGNYDVTVQNLNVVYSNQDGDYKNIFQIGHTERFVAKNVVLYNQGSYNRRLAAISNNSSAYFTDITVNINNFDGVRTIIAETDSTSSVSVVVAANQVPKPPELAGSGTNNLIIIEQAAS